jgi:ribosome-binding factor A
MKRKKSFRKDPFASCADLGPDDGVDPRTFFHKGARKKTNRKALQLCSEVARTLSCALAWGIGDGLLSNLLVESVVPAPDSSRLLVTVCWQPSAEIVPPEGVLERLHQYTGRLRAEVAAAVHRRRVPDLAFRLEMAKEVDQ